MRWKNRLREAVRQDRARIQISHISRFGLLEMSRQRLSPSLGESSHHVCPRCSGTGTVRDNESLSLSILRLIEEEALKENTQEVHAIVPVPIASYLLNEKRTAVNAIETRQDGVRCVIVPNDQMETPHYSVLRVRKGEETPTLSYMLPKLHEEAMALPSEEEFAERKRPEQPALATFAMPEVPPAPTPAEPPVKAAAPKAAVAPAAPAEPGLLSRFFGALKSLFSGSEEVKPAEQPAPKAAEKPERQQDRRKRQNNRRDRNDRNERRDNRDNRGERSENGENRDENRRNRRNAQQNAENRDNRQQATDVADKAKSGDEQQQQPRRERNRRRSDDKRQAQQEVKALNLDEQQTPETEQEERVRQAQPRRKQRQLNQKVRYHDQASEVAEVETATTEENVVAPVAAQAAPAQSTELVKVPLPVVTEATPEQDDNGEARDNAGMPRRSRRSPRHLRVSGQRRRRYRDERYPLQSPMPLTVACASPEMASGKVWIRYPVARPQDAQPEAQEIEQVQAQPVVTEPQAVAAAVEAVSAVEPAVETVVETVAEAPVQAEAVVETTHPEVIAAPVVEQPQVIADADVPVAEEVAAQAEPVAETQETAPVVEETPDVVTVEPETMTVVPDVVAAEPVAVEPEVVAEPEVIAEPVAAPVIVEAPTAPAPVSEPVVVAPVAEAAAPVVAESVAEHSHATAPMTRAPAPEYVPEAPRHSDWQRPAFAFDGKGAAGGHTASHSASAGPTRPQPVE